jgi:hypothetical protein
MTSEKSTDVNTDVKYVLTFQATGCPNGNLDPYNDPIQYWKTKSQDSVFDDMFLYCKLVKDNIASSDLSTQIERCCGTSTCTPDACVKQTEWTLATYEHVAGCKEGKTDCDWDGWACDGGTALENGLSFSECKNRARITDADGFMYIGTHSKYCTLCTFDQIANPVPSRYCGLYSKPV